MGSGWKKMQDKFEGSFKDVPSSSDWEQMNAKINAHPNLNTSKSNYKWLYALALFLLISAGFIYFLSENPVSVPTETQNIPDKEILHSPQENGWINTEHPISVKDKEKVNKNHLPNSSIKNEGILRNENPSIPTQNNNEHSKNTAEKEAFVNAIENNTEEDQSGIASIMEDDQSIPNPGITIDSTQYANENNETIQNSKRSAIEESNHISFDELKFKQLPELVNAEPSLITKKQLLDLGSRQKLFNLKAIHAGFKYQNDINSSDYGTAYGLMAEFKYKSLFFNTGLYFNEFYSFKNVIIEYQHWNVSSYTDSTFETHTEIHIDSAWVINGPWQGAYVYDTLTSTTIDTLLQIITDSSLVKVDLKNREKLRYSMVELPFMAGYRFQNGRLAFDLFGGVSIHQLKLMQNDIESTTSYGMDVIFSPGLRFYISPSISVFGNSGLRYGILQHDNRRGRVFGNFQLGLSYHL